MVKNYYFTTNRLIIIGSSDIKECEDPSLNDCVGKCIDVPGNYTCHCPQGYRGDGRKGGEGCTSEPSQVLQIALCKYHCV